MKRIATRLTDADITAVAAWLARQKPPADAVAREVERRAHAARLRQPAVDAMRKLAIVALVLVGGLIAAALVWTVVRPGALTGHVQSRERHGRRSSTAANTSRASATASPATPRPAANRSPAAARCRRHSGISTLPNITPDDETGIGLWTADDFYRMMHKGISRDGSLLYPAMPFASYTKVTREDCDAIYAYLMSVAARAAEEPPARAALPVQQARAPGRLAHALFQGRRVRPRSEAVGAMEPRRVPGRRPRPLLDVPHRHQPARRLERGAGFRRRDDPQPELVRAFAHVQPGGRSRQLEREGHRGPAAGRRVPSRHRVRPHGRSHLQQPSIPDGRGRRRRWRCI